MARIKGVDIPNDKHICISLTYIYGIGRSLANKICKNAKVDPTTYEGTRHKKGLPVRGQRTNRNARTRKGRGKVVANKKK